MKFEKRKFPLKVKTMMSQLAIDEEKGLETTNPADRHEETTAPDEEAIKLDQAEEEIPEVETTATGTANTATSEKSRDTDKRNAKRESKKINPAMMLKDTTGPRYTSWRRTKPKPSKRH
jgi:hypothetical protein